jgi:hypothetical protein
VSTHTRDGGRVQRRVVDYEYVAHHGPEQDPGLLVVRGVPSEGCARCDEYWFDETVGFALSELLTTHEPQPGRVKVIDWVGTDAA